mgnify:CR=1 FL=1
MDISELYQIYQAHPVITTDSRDCPKGSIFLALKGASFDGNKFADMALEKGCAYVIVDEKEYAKEGDERYILVEDCLTTFKELAREHRRHFDIPVVGITGTNGKTTTKELVSAVLGEKFNVMFTQGNFNNDVGVPTTLFRLSPENEIAVVEMGASHPGDIRKLVEYVEPTCGMITNVGRAHLQGFGSFEGVKKTKGELYDYLAANDALVFINADNEHLMQMAEQRNINRLITYGKDENCDVWGEVISCAPFLKFRWRTESFDWHEVQTHLIGSYNIDNMLAAITIGLHFDVKPQQIDHALENYIPSNNRSQLERDGKLALLSLPVAERWLRQAQLTPEVEPVCAQPLLIPLRLKASAAEKAALDKAQSALALLGIDLQSDAQHLTVRAVPLPLRQQNLQILIPELIGYLAQQKAFDVGNIAQWIARNLASEHAQWNMAQAITVLADVERLCPQLVKAPPGGLLQPVDLHSAMTALKDE